mgnify:CR=1 FL=1
MSLRLTNKKKHHARHLPGLAMMNASGVTCSGLRFAGECGDANPRLTRADWGPPRRVTRDGDKGARALR